ncbi:MAG: TIGR02147 family protein [Fibrobacter sp.]|nr:TIGR02147 family protein [Fibrobacter sp.]
MLPDVLDYLDYRDYLKEWYQESKKRNRFTSYRYISQKTDLDPAWIVRVFQKQGHLSEESLPKFEKLCRLDQRRIEYFRTLHHFCRTKSPEQQKDLYTRLMELRDIEARMLENAELSFYNHWFVGALRALIGITQDTSDLDKLAKNLSPAISPKEAESAIKVLQKLELIEEDGVGGWNITDRILTSGPQVQSGAVRNHHRQTLDLAIDSLDRHHPNQRDISSLTLTIDKEDIEEIKERIAAFRRGLLQFAHQSTTSNKVFQLNVSFFPLSETVSDPVGEE